jgi:NAD(P) transhydrogenase subunit alpha
MGVGVAGLQAIATARRLGAVVRAYDVRAAAKEEVQSLGATFVDLGSRAQRARAATPASCSPREFLARQRSWPATRWPPPTWSSPPPPSRARQAPVLVTTAMVEGMAEGAVIVDMAADSGGNCEVSQAGRGHRAPRRGGRAGWPTRPRPCPPTPASSTRATWPTSRPDRRDGALAPTGTTRSWWACCVLRDGKVVHGADRRAARGTAPRREITGHRGVRRSRAS